MNFKQTVQSMTASEIIMAMVRGLRRKWVRINFAKFGELKRGICFGCAATNTICEIMQQAFPPGFIEYRGSRAYFLKTDYEFLDRFEGSINILRWGYVIEYNASARIGGFKEIDKILWERWMAKHGELPRLDNEYFTKAKLIPYENFAQFLEKETMAISV